MFFFQENLYILIACKGIIPFLFIVEPKLTLFLFFFILVIMVIVKNLLKPSIKKAGKVKQYLQKERLKWLNQTVAGMKEIKISSVQEYFERTFGSSDKKYFNSVRKYSVLNKTPKLFIESCTMVGLISYMLIVVLLENNAVVLLTNLSAFAIALVKLLPSMNTFTTVLNDLVYYEPALNEVYETLNSGKIHVKENNISGNNECCIDLKKDIQLKNIDFHYYGKEKNLFNNVSINIPVGKSVGIKGTSGAGKTTIVDILLGLLHPQRGGVLVDGKNICENYQDWLKKIGYIPQFIFLMDDTIRRNVALGVNDKDISDAKVWRALEEAQIADFVHSLQDGLDTNIGERGSRLSGGQRQRLGIARALYHEPQLLVFDEATSALDNETEEAVMGAINSLHGKRTMIIIAHRLNTIEKCDMIYNIENGEATLIKDI